MASGFGRTGESQYRKEDHVRWYEIPDGTSGIVQRSLVGSPGGKWPAPFHEIQRFRRLGKGA
eukprot:9849481-Prorocentrum_lima.AAC.1